MACPQRRTQLEDRPRPSKPDWRAGGPWRAAAGTSRVPSWCCPRPRTPAAAAPALTGSAAAAPAVAAGEGELKVLATFAVAAARWSCSMAAVARPRRCLPSGSASALCKR